MNKKQEQEQAIEYLRNTLKDGSDIYTTVKHVSRSGMMRSIQTLIAVDHEIFDISYYAAQALGYKMDPKNGGVKVSGCGMDMCFFLVNKLENLLKIKLNYRCL